LIISQDYVGAKLLTFQGKNELPEYPQFNASRHLEKFGTNIMGIQHYSPVRGGWVCVGLSYLFTVKEGMPIVLRREGVTQLPTFDADWAHANMARAPTDYHRDIALVRREFKGDAILHNNNRLPSISVDPGLVRTTPSSSSQSEVEVSGSPAVTPTKLIVSFHPQLHCKVQHTQEPQGQLPSCCRLTIKQ